MNALEQDIQNLIRKPVDPEEVAEMARMFTGAMKCLMVCVAGFNVKVGGRVKKL